MRTLVPIVEGEGEVAALPVLIGRWLRHRNFQSHFQVDGPVRAPGKGALVAEHAQTGDLGIEHYLEIAMLRKPDAVLVLLDADGDCAVSLCSGLLNRATTVVGNLPIGVVAANRMYENWFLAAAEHISSRKGLERDKFEFHAPDIGSSSNIEDIQGCKHIVGRMIGRSYRPTVHQEHLTRHLPLSPIMRRRSKSFDKLLRELERLLQAARSKG